MFIKTAFKDSKYTKVADFCRKDADVSRSHGVCNVIYIFFGSSVGKIHHNIFHHMGQSIQEWTK